MYVNGNLDFKGTGKLIRPGLGITDFPPNPTAGELCLKNKSLFICVEVVDGLPFWVNLVNELSLHRHDQATPALEWTIVHTLNTNINIVQVYDAAGLQVIPDSIDSSVMNQVTVAFSTPTAGVALVSSGDLFGQPRPNVAFTESYTGSVWTVDHNLGYNPSITVIVGGYVVQPVSIVHNSTLQATITFSSSQTGSVRCV